MVNLLLNVSLATLFGGFCSDRVCVCVKRLWCYVQFIVCKRFSHGAAHKCAIALVCCDINLYSTLRVIIMGSIHSKIASPSRKEYFINLSEQTRNVRCRTERFQYGQRVILCVCVYAYMHVCVLSIAFNVFTINPVVIHCQRRHQ